MYLKRTYIYKDHIEVRKYHTSKYGIKGEKRRKKARPSDEAREKNNETVAQDRLRRLLINNFEEGDWHVVLTYSNESKPSVEESKKILQNFLRSMKREYAKQGIELKYIITTEWNKKRIHHHMAINNCEGFAKLLNKYWPYGGRHLTALYPDQDYAGLAEYLIKETKTTFRDQGNPYRQRYTCSRNLKKPEEKVEIINAAEWKSKPTVSKSLREEGYILEPDSLFEGIDLWGFPFQRYTFRKGVG